MIYSPSEYEVSRAQESLGLDRMQAINYVRSRELMRQRAEQQRRQRLVESIARFARAERDGSLA